MMLFEFYFICICISRSCCIFLLAGQCVSWKASLRVPVHSCPFPTNTQDSVILSTMADLVLSTRKVMYETWALLAGYISWESYLADPSGIFTNCDKKYREKFWKMSWKELLTLMCETEFSVVGFSCHWFWREEKTRSLNQASSKTIPYM